MIKSEIKGEIYMKEKFINQENLSKEFKEFIQNLDSFKDEDFKKVYDYISSFCYRVPTYENEVWYSDDMFFAFTDEEEFIKYCRGNEVDYKYLSFEEIFDILENNPNFKVVINCSFEKAPEINFKYENLINLLKLKLFNNIEQGLYILGAPNVNETLINSIRSEILDGPYKSIISARLYNSVCLFDNKDIKPIQHIELVLKLNDLPIRAYLDIKKIFETIAQENNTDIQIVFEESALGEFILSSSSGYIDILSKNQVEDNS